MPNLNPRVIGDLPYPNRSATTRSDLNVGGLLTAPITTPGTGYTIGEQVTITSPPSGGIQAVAEIETVDGAGGILTIKVTNPGAGYTVAPTISDPSPTTGTGAVYDTSTISSVVPVFLGRIYTTSAGRLIIPTAAGSVADLTDGVLQVRATTVIGDGFTQVQVVTPPTRILLKAPAGIKLNDKVDLDTPTASTVDQEKVKKGGNTFSSGYIGRVFEIDTKNTDGSKKLVTVDNDLVVIDMGVAQ